MTAGRRAFPLVPRRRVVGTPFGVRRGARRGRGSELAGTREYLPGDPVSTIDWYASARLSSARGSDEFVVRELYVDESPRVVIAVDRRPSMGLYPSGLPWLDKPAAVAAAAEAIALAAATARAELGHADTPDGRPRVLAPGAVAPRAVLDRVRRGSYGAAPSSFAATLGELATRRAELPEGTFVFVLSDFLGEVPASRWTRLRGAGFDVVPVIVQDPVWEQSFPPVAGVLVPFASPEGETALVRLGARDTRERRAENEARLERIVNGFRRLGFDPLVLSSAAPATVQAAFLHWAERRRALLRRR